MDKMKCDPAESENWLIEEGKRRAVIASLLFPASLNSWPNNGSNPIIVNRFPDSESGPFYITQNMAPWYVFLTNHKNHRILGVKRVKTARIFPLTADQCRYWKTVRGTEFGPKPASNGTPIKWYNDQGQIKEEYMKEWEEEISKG